MKTKLLKLALCAMAALPLGAWAADVTLPSRSATNELFRLERQGAYNKYFISGGTLTLSSSIGDPDTNDGSELTNTWGINANDRYVGFTLPSGYTFAEGDMITITGGLFNSYSSGRGFKLQETVSAPTFIKNIDVESSYKAHKKTTISYTITAGDGIIGKNSLYIFRETTINAYVENVVVTRTGADDLVPEAVSDKEWNLPTILSGETAGNAFASSVVNDNLYFAKSSTVNTNGGTDKYIRLTAAVANELDYTSMENGLAFILKAGKGYVTVYASGDNTPNFHTKNGASATNLSSSFKAGIKDGTTNLKPYSYVYDLDYDTPISVIRGSSNTYIAKIVVSPAVHVSVASSGYSTFCSPVALNLAELPSGLKAYKVESSNVNSTKVTLTEVTEAVMANTPLILTGTPGETYDIPVITSDNDISTTNALVQGDGTTDGVAKEDGYTKFVLQGGQFKKIDTTPATVPTTKAYLKITGDVAANALTLDFGDVTAIKSVKETSVTSEDYYNLNGQRVNNPTKGLYVVNGKKVIIK